MAAVGSPIVTARALSLIYPAAAGLRPVCALHDISLTISPGEFAAVIGHSGAGKTSLLRCLTGFVRPSTGTLMVAGADVGRARGKGLRRLRRHTAVIAQHFNLVERLSVLDNVLMGRLGHVATVPSLLGWFPRSDRALAYGLLCELGLGDRALQRVDRLSGGERQRVAIARALAQRPLLVLADEPAASLDISLTRVVLDILCRLNGERGLTVIASLHNLHLARAYASRILGLRDGALVFDGAPADLTEASQWEIYDGGEPADRSPGAEPRPIAAAATG